MLREMEHSPEPGSWAAKGGPEPASFRVAEGVSAKQHQDRKHRAHPSLGIIGRALFSFYGGKILECVYSYRSSMRAAIVGEYWLC